MLPPKLFHSKQWIYIGILTPLLCPSLLHAKQDAEESVDVIGFNKSSDSQLSVDKNTYTGFVSSIQRAEFEDRFTQVIELLSDFPSVQIKTTGGFGSYSSTSLRGSTGKQVNVYLDGLLLNSPFSGDANMSNIPTSIIKQVDVYPDFTPVELSTANLAGAVNLTSRNLSEFEPGLQASLGYGSFHTRSAEISAWTNLNAWQLLGAVNTLDSKNDYPVNDKSFDTDSETRINSQYKGSSIFLKAAKQWNVLRLQLLYQAQDTRSGIPTEKIGWQTMPF